MKFTIRWAIRLMILLVIVVLLVVVFKDPFFKWRLESRIRSKTGMAATIGSFKSDLLNPAITIQDLKLYNPPEFGGTVFLDLPEVALEFDPAELDSSQFRLRLLRIHLAEIHIVENKEGLTNLDALESKLKDHGRALEMKFGGIDTLKLSIGRIRYTSLGRPARNREYTIDLINEQVRNVRTTADLSGVVLKILVKQIALLRGSKPGLTASVPFSAAAMIIQPLFKLLADSARAAD